MAGSISDAQSSPIPDLAPTPTKLHHLGRAFGLLQSIRPDEDCQLAQIGTRLVVLPQDLDLSGHIGQRIGLILVDEKYLVRRLSA